MAIQDPEPTQGLAPTPQGLAQPAPSKASVVGAVLELSGTIEAQCSLFAAFSKASAVFGEIKKDMPGQVGNQRFKYADLGVIMRTVRPALSANGLVLIQAFGGCPKGTDWMRAVSILAGHGAMIRTEFDFLHERMSETSGGGIPLQKLGVAMGYIRRMQAQALLGISPDNDPDAVRTNSPTQDPAPAYQKQSSPPPTPAVNTRRTTRAKSPVNKPPTKAQGKTESSPPKSEVAAPISTAPPTPKAEERAPVETVELPSPVTDPKPAVSLEVTDGQRAELRACAKDVGISKAPAINKFIKAYLESWSGETIGDLTGPQVNEVIDLLKRRAASMVMGSK